MTTSVTESKLRTGSLQLGTASGMLVEFGCQATNITIASAYSEDGDPMEVLCGQQLPAATTVAKTLKITSIQDFDDPAGFMRFLRAHELQEVQFEWRANPVAEVASGTVQARLGDWGGDVGKRTTTAPELPIVSLQWAPPPPATGATAGTPGAFTPAGSAPPLNLAALQAGAVVANPATAWTVGQYVVAWDGAYAHWDASAWEAGAAP